jgi:mxaL protein
VKYFHHLQRYLVHRRDATLLLLAFVFLIIALFQPSIPLKRNIYSYILVADISQSMNVADMGSEGNPVTRIAHTQKMMHEIISAMPCGTKVSIGLFAGVSVAAMYTPIEVCSNFAAINDTIDHLDWRAGWSGNSRIRESLPNLARTLRAFPEPAQVVYFTDGEEAPRLHVFNTRNLSEFQGGDDWLLVGVGSDKGTPIPKLDEKNQLIGYWSGDSFALQPGIAQISESNIGTRDDNVASGEGDRYLSTLNETYLQDLTKEVSAKYVRGDKLQNILAAMKEQKPARRDIAPYKIDWVLASIAGILLLLAYFPKHPLQASRESINRMKFRLRRATSR